MPPHSAPRAQPPLPAKPEERHKVLSHMALLRIHAIFCCKSRARRVRESLLAELSQFRHGILNRQRLGHSHSENTSEPKLVLLGQNSAPGTCKCGYLNQSNVYQIPLNFKKFIISIFIKISTRYFCNRPILYSMSSLIIKHILQLTHSFFTVTQRKKPLAKSAESKCFEIPDKC